jgi:hypothetical protein
VTDTLPYNEPVWAKHFQAAWENDAARHDLPVWFRMMALAYGRHAANGHANFRRGDLSKILGEPGPDGEWIRRDRYTIRDTIKHLVSLGLLAPDSGSECLVVPHHRIQGGKNAKYDADRPCPVHARKVLRRSGSPLRKRFLEGD